MDKNILNEISHEMLADVFVRAVANYIEDSKWQAFHFLEAIKDFGTNGMEDG